MPKWTRGPVTMWHTFHLYVAHKYLRINRSHPFQLPNHFSDFAATFHKKWDTQQKDILTHCRRELIHAVWNLLLDDAFMHAFKYGIVIKCADGVERRVYPWFFTYSADYPEKCTFLLTFFFVLNDFSRVLLAMVRDKGLCPCPQCLTPKAKLNLMGWHNDSRSRRSIRMYMRNLVTKARSLIYDKAIPIMGAAVEEMLKPTSLVPTLVSALSSMLKCSLLQ